MKESKEDEIVNGKKLEELLSHSSSGNAPSDDGMYFSNFHHFLFLFNFRNRFIHFNVCIVNL